ncbi:MAG: ATP-dependent DNA ligase, partial [Acidobacteria bacterium]|nr:ATP-dependent DNA ligase [Acidobacteriota bacterium]
MTITHPEKVLFPDSGITKGELAAYYEMIAPVMVPHMRGRPVTMERYHRGIGAPGFFQKDVSKGFPDWLERVEVPKKGGTVHHPIVTDTRSLLCLANQNCITPHVWTSRVPDLYSPDICVFDLDPSEDNPPQLRAAAFQLRDLLAELGLPSWLKTSGSKGFHIVVPLDGKSKTGEVASFAHAVGAVLVRRDPENLTQEFHKAD